MKRLVMALLAFVFLMSAALALPACAETITQDGLVVTLTTDKESYKPGERIKATLTVTNTSNTVFSNVSIDHLVPNGYQVNDGEITKQLQSLDAGDTITLAVTYTAIDVVLPQTGDHSNISLWMLILLIGSAGIVIVLLLNKKSRKMLLSLLLCIALISPMAFCASAKAAKSETKNIAISQNVMIGDVNTEISAVITYAGLSYKVEFDLNYKGASGAPAMQYIAPGQRIIEPEEPARAGYVFYGWSINPNGIAWIDYGVDFDTYSVLENTVFYAIWESEEEDIDGDGLTYKDEARYHTDPFLYDTDSDGLSDGDEIEHGTDPLNPDTDGDGLEDGLEVYLGLSPLKEKTDGRTDDPQRIMDTAYETFDGQFTLSLSATPVTIRTFSVETLALSNLKDSTGLVSRIISIDYDKSQSFSNAQLVFDYSDVDLGGIDPDSLTFLYLNETTGKLDVIPSRVDKNNKLVIATPTHFSSYAVGSASRGASSFSYADALTLEYEGRSIQAREVVATGFDVKKHAFAFHNFEAPQSEGVCYGISFTTYLSYIGKLPISREKVWNPKPFVSYAPSYDLSDDRRFFTEQLYDSSESNLFNESNQNTWIKDNVDESKHQMLYCIVHWQLMQNNVADRLTNSLYEFAKIRELKTKLENDEPVPLAMLTRGVGAFATYHYVLICGVYESLEDSNYYISIYDSNNPGRMKYIKMTLNNGIFGNSVSYEYVVKGIDQNGKDVEHNYVTFNMANLTIPDGPYVPHESDITANVTGKVVNSSGVGIPQARVTIINDDFEKSVTTNSTGEYSITQVPNGRYQILIEANGFESVTINNVVVSNIDEVIDAVVLKHILFAETSDVRGVVTIADTDTDMTNNLPLKGACVSIELTGYMSKEAYTAANGEYILPDIPEGTYLVTVSKDGYIPVTQRLTVSNGNDVIYNIAIESISREHEGIGYASGVVYDVGTGRPVQGLSLKVRNGLNNTTGTVLQTLYTDQYGRYTTLGIEAGNYTIQVVDNRSGIADSQRYTTTSFNIKVLGEMTIGNQNGYVTNGLVSGELRVVLTWGASPSDLDSHMVGPDGKGGKFHEFFSVRNNGSDTDLDVDDTSSYGPETITVYKEYDGTYVYAVHDYSNRGSSNSTALSNSGAQVNVYRGSHLLATYNVPTNRGGTLWTVFSYDSTTQRIKAINEMTYESNQDNVLSSAAFALRAKANSDAKQGNDSEYADEISRIVADIFATEKE